MRTAIVLTFALATAISAVHAQTNQFAGSGEAVRTYSLLREDEDWSFLKDPSLRQDFWDPIKYISLGPDGWYLSVGGDVREVFEQVGNDNWGKQPYTNAFFLERYMLHTDWHLGKFVRAFVQLKSGLESFRAGGPRPIDEKKLDFEAAFIEVGTTSGDNWLALQAGRQELNYGSGRLVSVREGPNVRQSFDGAKLKSKRGEWRVDLFAARPDLDKPGFFNNVPDHRTAFWGVYATRPLRRRVSIDSYYLGLDRKSATFNRGTATENRESLGVRLWRSPATNEHDWDFDYEGVWQFGSFGADRIRAWTFASDSGYSFPAAPLRPRISVKADISSGDDPRKSSLGTFNPLFPVGNYFGVLADTGPGPLNFIDVHPKLQTWLPRGVSISTDLVVQWRESLYDGVYAVPGFLLVPAGNSRARFVGYRPGVEARWQIDRHAICRPTMESSSPANSSNRPHRAGTSITQSSGWDTNSDATVMSDPVVSRAPIGTLMAMTVVTGIVDAISFIAMGHVFAANMTGNVVLLGFAFAGIPGLSISRSAVALLAFLFGAVLGGRLALNASSWRGWAARGFMLEALLLGIAAVAALGIGSSATVNPLHLHAVIASTALAIGLRNAIVRKLAVPDMTTTVLTLTITGLAADSSLAGGDNPRWQRRGAAILAMIFGAFAGARMVIHSISLPLAISCGITATCAVARRHSDLQGRES